MWYAYEGESELYAIPAESVKKIIEMNHNQEYPEKLEDFQVELMSTAALAQETNAAEFERELRRMSDDSGDNGVAKEEESPKTDRHDRKGGARKGGDRPRGNEKNDRPRNDQKQRRADHTREEQRQRLNDQPQRVNNNRHSGARNNPRRSGNKDKRE
jgi:hypothetical protein